MLTARPLLLVALPLLVASPLTNPLQAQSTTAPAAPATAPAATETYESLAQRAAELRRRTRSEKTAEAAKSLQEARDLFVKAADRAADDEKKADAYIQAAEISIELDDYDKGYKNYSAAAWLKNISAPIRIKATLLEASTQRVNQQRRYQWPGNAYMIRFIYERALKIPELSGEQRLEVQTYVADNFAVENKRIEAAQEYEKISKAQAADKEASLTSLRLAAYWIGPEHQSKSSSTAIKPADALPIINSIYTELLKREPAAKKSVLQLDWAQALVMHSNPDQAVTVLAELRDDSVLPVAERKNTLLKIAASQSANKSYDKALSTWEILGKIPGSNQSELAQVASERATLFVKLNKEAEARAELKTLLQLPITPANKVRAWHESGLSYNREREVKAKAKAPEAELSSLSANAQTAFESAFNVADGPVDARLDALIERANIDAGAQRLPAAREWLQKGLAITTITPAAKQRLLYLVAKVYGFEKNHTQALATYQLALAEPVTNYKNDIGQDLKTALAASFTEKNWDAARNYLNELEKQNFASAAGVLYDRANIENQAGNKPAALAALNSLETTYGAQLNANDKATIAALRKQIEPPPVSLTGN